jgi:pullulanase-type alpha-1,6-glucosidase
VPEGSYATNAMGITRIVEFREMVQSLHLIGFRVIMDVVYNHTHQFGLAKNSVLDKIVPGYYHRLQPLTGEVEQSTCYTCGNTATERVMMEKLMTDSLITWARDYKIDGFRFDLMGHQPKKAMLSARQAVRAIDPDTYFYGEGWNFGEVANHSQFTQASQLALGGSEIGTFSDRLRDAVRGSGNNTRQTQGIGNGLLTQPNELQNNAETKAQYLINMDQIRIGLAANLAQFPLDNKTLGKDIPYGNQPTGYALDPADTISYVSKHDNQTLWDNSQYRLPFNTSTKDRVRYHNLSLAYVLLGQGIPFIHMGSEFLRSKSFLRDSYDYGDWFNAIDYKGNSNNYHVGLPPADKDANNWPLIKRVLRGHQGKDKPNPADILLARDVFKDMLAIRTSSPLFSLTTADAIVAKVSFLNRPQTVEDANHQQGLIVMHLDDQKGIAVDPKLASIMVLFNSSDQPRLFSHPDAEKFSLHQQIIDGSDEISKTAKTTATGFYVPAITAAVFVK